MSVVSSRLLALAFALTVSAAVAGPYTWVIDPDDDHAGSDVFSVLGLGWRVEAGQLDVVIRTNFPASGVTSNVGYGTELIRPGDLYINVGGSYVAGTGSAFGLGLTNHSGDVTAQAADNSLPWLPVSTGQLYADAIFATGTLESYANAGIGGTPYDGGDDPFGGRNNLPALIAGYSGPVGSPTTVTYTSIASQPWAYEIATSISLADLGMATGYHTFELWWSMECGNDAVMAAGAVPEPASLAFLAASGLLLWRRRRGGLRGV